MRPRAYDIGFSQQKFAFFPTRLFNGNRIWLKKYWFFHVTYGVWARSFRACTFDGVVRESQLYLMDRMFTDPPKGFKDLGASPFPRPVFEIFEGHNRKLYWRVVHRNHHGNLGLNIDDPI